MLFVPFVARIYAGGLTEATFGAPTAPTVVFGTPTVFRFAAKRALSWAARVFEVARSASSAFSKVVSCAALHPPAAIWDCAAWIWPCSVNRRDCEADAF